MWTLHVYRRRFFEPISGKRIDIASMSSHPAWFPAADEADQCLATGSSYFPFAPHSSESRQASSGFALLCSTNNFQEFLEMLDGAQTGRDEAGNLVPS